MRDLIVADDGNVEVVAPIAKRLGCGIEMQAFYDPSAYESDTGMFVRHREAVEGVGLRSVHGCYGDLCPGSFDAMVRSVARNRYELSYRAAVEVGAQHLVVHHGYVPHTSPPTRWLPRARAFWMDFLHDKPDSIQVHMENMLDWDPFLIRDLVDSVGSAVLDINLDLGHAYCDSRTDVVDWVRQLGSRIGYVHMQDNHRTEIDRFPLGKGSVPLKEACAALEEEAPSAYWVIETENSGIVESLEWLNKAGYWTPRSA